MSKSLVKNIQNFAFQNNLWEKNSKIIIGVSGGPDSVCLLHILKKLSSKYNFTLYVAHVNYGLRKKDSDDDEKFTRKLAATLGIDISILKIDRKNLGKKPSENHLRNIRYEFFEKIRTEKKFDFIAVAHNRDDQVETVLMRIIRGAGLMGISSMKPKNNNIIRPLLGTSRKDILAYLKKEKLSYQTDITNKETVFLRNKVRNRLIPYLEKNYNPNIRKTLFSVASTASSDYDFMVETAKEKFSSVLLKKDSDGIVLSVSKLSALHAAIQNIVLRLAIEKVKGDLKGVESSNIDEILKIVKSSKKKAQILSFRGLKIEKKGDKMSIVKYINLKSK